MKSALGEIVGLSKQVIQEGIWTLDADDMMLFALLCDGVYHPELLWADPKNREYSGCYRVMDYQYPLFRSYEENYAGFPCGRSVGKTESEKSRASIHAFRRQGEGMLITAPELIHLLPLTDAIEERIMETRLLREFLKVENQKTGFTHRPFQCDFADGTKIIGRIPKITGTGVKGQHIPDLIVEEAQDYPERGWTEVHETVIKDHTDKDGNYDFTYHFYGVHSGARDTGFYKRTSQGGFRVTQITRLMTKGWNAQEKQAAIAAYGGTSSPDYRRNILGEPGAAASAFFVIARLVACLDQDRESIYNTVGYKHQRLQAEEVDKMGVPVEELLDLPTNDEYRELYAGADIGLTNSPTVLSIFAKLADSKRKTRMRLIRRITLERFREKQIRQVFYKMGWTYGQRLHAFGVDATGLGYPIFQAMEDDETAPSHLIEVTRGYKFNALVPVGVDETFVSKDTNGVMRDQYGSTVKLERDPLTGVERLVTYMSMIEASTRYLREMVDSTFLQLPFDTEITADMQAETQQRVKAIAGMKSKPNAFHILDSFRGMAMAYKAGDIEQQLAVPDRQPVLDQALDGVMTGGMTL